MSVSPLSLPHSFTGAGESSFNEMEDEGRIRNRGRSEVDRLETGL